MPLLANASDTIEVVTSAAVTSVDVVLWFSDYDASTKAASFASAATSITTATTTTVLTAPASGVRKLREMSIRNTSAASTVSVTVRIKIGGTRYELHEATVGPGGEVAFAQDRWFDVPATPSSGTNPWDGQIVAAYGDGRPGDLFQHLQRAGNVAGTPTNFTTSVARCNSFRVSAPITVNRIRFYGVGATTNVFRVAIYRYSDLARLTAELPYSTVANAWGSAGASLGVTLAPGVVYFMATSVNAVGTTAGPVCVGSTLAATTGQIQSTPSALPGSLSLNAGYLGSYAFQFAVTTGALPSTAATPAAGAAWTGGVPAYWLDSADV